MNKLANENSYKIFLITNSQNLHSGEKLGEETQKNLDKM